MFIILLRTVMIRCRDEAEDEPEETFFIFSCEPASKKIWNNVDEGEDEAERGIYPIIM